MGHKEKLEKLLKDLNASFEKSKLLSYMDFDSKHFIFRQEYSQSNSNSYNPLASYNPENDNFYILRELFTPGVLDKQQKMQNTESQKAIIMHEEVHRAVIKSGLLDKCSSDPAISSTFYLDKHHSLPFVLASLKFKGNISNYIYNGEELEDFRSAFSSVEKFFDYVNESSLNSNFDIYNIHLLDFRNSSESAAEIAKKLKLKGIKFRDGTMFAVKDKNAMFYFDSSFYLSKLNDNYDGISIEYEKILL